MNYVKEIIEDAGNGVQSEDRLLLSDRILGVIDGATPIHKLPAGTFSTQAEWMTDGFVKGFSQRVRDGAEHYEEIARTVIDEMSCQDVVAHWEYFDRPSFTSATVTLCDGRLRCQVIGDSCIYVHKRSGEIVRITDERVDEFSARTAKAVELARMQGRDEKEAAERQKSENIRKRNTPGGYWVVAFDGAFEKEFVEREFMAGKVDRILLCTDGLERLFRDFALMTPEEFFDKRVSLRQALAGLRKYEREQFGRPDFPCVKQSDDVAAVLLEFTE